MALNDSNKPDQTDSGTSGEESPPYNRISQENPKFKKLRGIISNAINNRRSGRDPYLKEIQLFTIEERDSVSILFSKKNPYVQFELGGVSMLIFCPQYIPHLRRIDEIDIQSGVYLYIEKPKLGIFYFELIKDTPVGLNSLLFGASGTTGEKNTLAEASCTMMYDRYGSPMITLSNPTSPQTKRELTVFSQRQDLIRNIGHDEDGNSNNTPNRMVDLTAK